MAISISIPHILRSFTNNQETVEVEGATVKELLSNLDTKYPGINKRLRNAEGKLNRGAGIYVNDEDIRYLQEEETPLKDGDTITILSMFAGG